MTVFNTLKLGNSSDKGFASNNGSVKTISTVIDIARLKAAGYIAGDQVAIMSLPKNSAILFLDAIITETLVLGASNSVDIGTDVTDPDEYVDNQTTTAVGRFGAYVAVTRPEIFATAQTLYAEINGAALTSGKISLSVVIVAPADENPVVAGAKKYTYSK